LVTEEGIFWNVGAGWYLIDRYGRMV